MTGLVLDIAYYSQTVRWNKIDRKKKRIAQVFVHSGVTFIGFSGSSYNQLQKATIATLHMYIMNCSKYNEAERNTTENHFRQDKNRNRLVRRKTF